MRERITYFFNQRAVVVVVFLLMAYYYGTVSDRHFGWTNDEVKEGDPVLSDGAGYYAYLPQWFIYKTSNFEFLHDIKNDYPDTRFIDNIYTWDTTKITNKYYTGTAVAMTPFFGMAHAYAAATGYEQDGYSKPYMVAVNIGALCWAMLGLLMVYLLLLRLEISRFWSLFTVVLIALGTNLSYYVAYLPSCCHAVSFGVVSCLLYVTRLLAEKHTVRRWLLVCFFFGLALIIRPTNGLVLLFLPFLFDSFAAFRTWLRQLFGRYFLQAAFGVLFTIAIVSFQLFSTHQQTGQWRLNTYTDEGFDFITRPKLWDVFFSFRKGLFIFAPVLLLFFPGLIYVYRHQRFMFRGTVLFFCVFSWITASWWCWYYGGGLGMRPFIDVFGILFIPIAFLLQHSKLVWKLPVIAFSLVSVWIYGIYETQMKKDILHYSDMTYEQFASVFLKTDDRYSYFLHIRYEQLPAQKKLIHAQKMPFLPADMTFPKPYPKAVIQSDHSANLVGLEVTASYKLTDGAANPICVVTYYRDTTVVKEVGYGAGPFIDDIHTWSRVKLQFNPGLRYNEVDSIGIYIGPGTAIEMKNVRLKAFHVGPQEVEK